MAIYDQTLIARRKRPIDFEDSTNISLRNKYVYFAVDKVANSSIKNSLYTIELESVNKAPPSPFDKRLSPLLSPYQLPPDLLRVVLNSGNYFRFAFVRNPYSRTLSCYLDRILNPTSKPRAHLLRTLKAKDVVTEDISFDLFVRTICAQKSPDQNSHWRVQADDILWGDMEFDFIGKFENLWEDMGEVSRRIWGEVRPPMAASEVNKSPKVTNAGSKLAQFYTPELADLIYERFRADFDAFGYSRDFAAA
ncbi:sulfotransferase family 2 domain-containing protein [Arenimonas daejeonensis]|uniref:sulfotransferase family 2 domain-containing protein n=1 Tax=Arenimonas daejeonensis TaxID=370777 RepID=UPI00131544D2|nr:sulfotransferase family 2 domain-containing protein [Arenimonas daejeonensis]